MARYLDRISVEPKVMGGQPCIKGTRIPVITIVRDMAAGITANEIMDQYDLKAEDIFGALEYAASTIEDSHVQVLPLRDIA